MTRIQHHHHLVKMATRKRKAAASPVEDDAKRRSKPTGLAETYGNGPSFRGPLLSTHKVCGLLKSLHETFGEGHKFEPESITEGGIVWRQWPGKRPDDRESYKSMRFHPLEAAITRKGRGQHRHGSTDVGQWPWIGRVDADGLIREWQTSADKPIFAPRSSPSGTCNTDIRIDTFLKAFRGAPVWTLDQLEKFEHAFTAIEFRRCGRLARRPHLS
jgi:hypothetical protein